LAFGQVVQKNKDKDCSHRVYLLKSTKLRTSYDQNMDTDSPAYLS
jgi:hypothetical protein